MATNPARVWPACVPCYALDADPCTGLPVSMACPMKPLRAVKPGDCAQVRLQTGAVRSEERDGRHEHAAAPACSSSLCPMLVASSRFPNDFHRPAPIWGELPHVIPTSGLASRCWSGPANRPTQSSVTAERTKVLNSGCRNRRNWLPRKLNGLLASRKAMPGVPSPQRGAARPDDRSVALRSDPLQPSAHPARSTSLPLDI